MKKFLLFSLAIVSFSSLAQSSIEVKTIIFTETVDKSSKSNIPYIVYKTGNNKAIADKINESIQDRFMIHSFDPKKVTEFRWYDVEFTHQIIENILHIGFAGVYYGAYPNYVEDNLYYDLKTGDKMEGIYLSTSSLFSLQGYYDFLNKYWLTECLKAYQEAIECAGFEPYCSCYDIDFTFGSAETSFSLTDDCFPHVARACSPGHGMGLDNDTLRNYLNDFGKWVLFETNYASASTLEKFLFFRKNYNKIPSYMFLVGKIDNKYAFSMALDISESTGKASGYYYYEKQKIRIPLHGTAHPDRIELTETVNGQVTGKFSFLITDAYPGNGIHINNKYLTCTWLNVKPNKVMPVVFTSAKRSN